MAREDLVSLADRTTEEQQKIASKGGKKSVESRRKKKELHERISIAFDIYTQKLKEKAETEEDKRIIEEMGADVFQMISIAYSNKTKEETKIKALESLWNRSHGAPDQKVKVEHSIDKKETQGVNKKLLDSLEITDAEVVSDDIEEDQENTETS